jgi:hypothetical protein
MFSGFVVMTVPGKWCTPTVKCECSDVDHGNNMHARSPWTQNIKIGKYVVPVTPTPPPPRVSVKGNRIQGWQSKQCKPGLERKADICICDRVRATKAQTVYVCVYRTIRIRESTNRPNRGDGDRLCTCFLYRPHTPYPCAHTLQWICHWSTSRRDKKTTHPHRLPFTVRCTVPTRSKLSIFPALSMGIECGRMESARK